MGVPDGNAMPRRRYANSMEFTCSVVFISMHQQNLLGVGTEPKLISFRI
jgi:hypothetical protein